MQSKLEGYEWSSAPIISAVLCFSVLAHGAHDLWSATLVYMAALALLATMFCRVAWFPGPGVSTSLLPPLAFVAAVLGFSFSQAVHPSESFMGLLDWLAAMAVFWVAIHAFVSDASVDLFVRCIVPIFWIEAGMSLYQQLTLDHPFREQVWGTLINANFAAAFMVLWMPVLWQRLADSWNASRRVFWYWLSGVSANLISFSLAFSSWGWICIVCCSPLLLGSDQIQDLLRRHSRKVWALAAGGLLLVTCMVFWKLLHGFDAVGHPVNPGENVSRLLWWRSGLKMFLDHPWLGVGIGNFPSAYLAYKTGHVMNTMYGHSLLVSLLAETGLLGTMSLSVLLFCCMRLFWIHRDKIGKRNSFLVGVIMFLFFSAINVSVEMLANLLTLAVFLGIIAASVVEARWRPQKSVAIVVVALSLALIPYVLGPWTASRIAEGAEEQLKSGNVQAAIKGFSSAAAVDSRSSEAERGLARAFYARYSKTHDAESLNQTVFHQQRSVELNRLEGLLWMELAKYLSDRGDREKASECYRRATELRVNDHFFRSAL